MLFFFFKQKTAYEMRISDWSSDVCSSDLAAPTPSPSAQGAGPAAGPELQIDPSAYPPPLALQDLPATREAIEAAVAERARELRAARQVARQAAEGPTRSEEHTSELQSLMRNSYAVFCLKKKKKKRHNK